MRWGIPNRLCQWHAVVTVFTAVLIFGTQAGLGSFALVNPAADSGAFLIGIPEYLVLALLLSELFLSLTIAWRKADASTLLSITLLGIIWISLAAIVAPEAHFIRTILPGLLPHQIFTMTWMVTTAWAARGFLALLIASVGEDNHPPPTTHLRAVRA